MLWANEEALKCEGLAAVVGEIREISFAQSRRLQLAVENSKVTGFLLHTDPKKLGTYSKSNITKATYTDYSVNKVTTTQYNYTYNSYGQPTALYSGGKLLVAFNY